jgi:hypothetical protein
MPSSSLQMYKVELTSLSRKVESAVRNQCTTNQLCSSSMPCSTPFRRTIFLYSL